MISPFILVTLLMFISIINNNVKGIIYMCGVVILFGLVYISQNSLKSVVPFKASETCTLFFFPKPLYGIPSFNSSLFAFTICYLLAPMLSSGVINMALMLVLISLYVIDVIIRLKDECTTPLGVLLGSMIGVVWGMVWFAIFVSSSPELLYYDDMISSKQACSRPTKQSFKCQVRKDKLM
jgi:hypothetical protein